MKNLLIFLFTFFLTQLQAQVGINTDSPTNSLHVKGNGITHPLRVESLQSSTQYASAVVSNGAGVLKERNYSSISAVKAKGSLVIVTNNLFTNISAGITPIEDFDNLNEFNSFTFTANQNGLYLVSFTGIFPQRPASQDLADGYLGLINIIGSNGTARGKISIPEASGIAANEYLNVKRLVKLAAGGTLNFECLVYGSTVDVDHNLPVSYEINIVRLD